MRNISETLRLRNLVSGMRKDREKQVTVFLLTSREPEVNQSISLSQAGRIWQHPWGEDCPESICCSLTLMYVTHSICLVGGPGSH